MSELKAVPENPLFVDNPKSLRDKNAIIGPNAMETFENVDAVLALLNDIHLLVESSDDAPFTPRGHFGYFICVEAARSALRTQLEIMHKPGGQSPTD